MTDAPKPVQESILSSTEDVSLEEDDLFHCRLLSIKVENRIFRVPRELLETYSNVYKDMFNLPISSDEPADGERDIAPLILEGIKKEDFRAFLSVLSSLHYESLQRGESKRAVFVIAKLPLYEGLQKKDWIAALRLSHMWDLDNVRKKAINVLEGDATLGMLQRLELANEFQITTWIRPAYRYLLTRSEELNVAEVSWMGPSGSNFVERVAKGREERVQLYLMHILGKDAAIPPCPICKEHSLKFSGFERQASPTSQDGWNHRGKSMQWLFVCSKAASGSLHQYSHIQNVGWVPISFKNSWTLEELVDSIYKNASEDLKTLMDKDINLIIDTLLPIS